MIQAAPPQTPGRLSIPGNASPRSRATHWRIWALSAGGRVSSCFWMSSRMLMIDLRGSLAIIRRSQAPVRTVSCGAIPDNAPGDISPTRASPAEPAAAGRPAGSSGADTPVDGPDESGDAPGGGPLSGPDLIAGLGQSALDAAGELGAGWGMVAGCAECSDRLCQLPPGLEGGAEVGVGVGIVGFEPDRRTVRGDRLFQLTPVV